MASLPCPKCSRCLCECGVLPLTAQVTITGLEPQGKSRLGGNATYVYFDGIFSAPSSAPLVEVTEPGGCLPGLGIESRCGDKDPVYCDENADDRGPVAGVALIHGGSCLAIPARSEPDITLTAQPGEGGEEATFTPILSIGYESFGPRDDIPVWSISGVTVEGGSGYQGGEAVKVSIAARPLPSEKYEPEDARGDRELEPASITVVANGEGVPVGCHIAKGGQYYKERFDIPGLTFPVVGKVPTGLTNDSGAIINGIVDVDATSETFGEVIDLEIVEGGDGVFVWQRNRAVSHILSGRPLTLRATQTRPLVSVEADACFGSGVCVTVEAVDERSEPALDFDGLGICISPGAWLLGCDGQFSLSTKVTYENDDPTRPVWSLESIDASGGRLYGNQQPTAAGVFILSDLVTGEKVYPGDGFCGITGPLPAVTLNVDPPSNAGFPWADPPVPPSGGVIVGATINSPGAFYQYRKYMGEPVPVQRITLTNPGEGYAEFGRIAPTLTLQPPASIGGSGVTLTPTLGVEQDECGRDYWFLDGVKVAGGAGYSSSGQVLITAAIGDTTNSPAEVTLNVGDDGIPVDATITDPGKYWRESQDAPPYVATLTSRVLQLPPSKGEGAVISFVVEDDPHSPQFGQVTKAEIVNGGSGYITLGQAGCEYESPCGATLTLARDKTTLEGILPYGIYLFMTGPGFEGNCETGTVTLAPAAGNGTGASAAWPAPSGNPCGAGECFCLCPPNLHLLCFTVTWIDSRGRTITATTQDAGGLPNGIAWTLISDAEGEGNPFSYDAELSLLIRCNYGMLYLDAFSVDFGFQYDDPQTCFCTGASGCDARFCGTGNWWDGTYEITLEYDEGLQCEGCPPPGRVTVTISTPDEPMEVPC